MEVHPLLHQILLQQVVEVEVEEASHGPSVINRRILVVVVIGCNPGGAGNTPSVSPPQGNKWKGNAAGNPAGGGGGAVA